MKTESEITQQLANLEVTKVWISVGSWLWIEFGELIKIPGFVSPHGQYTIEIACRWKLYQNEEILVHSESKHPFKDEDVAKFILGKKFLSFNTSENNTAIIQFTENTYLKIQFNELPFSILSHMETIFTSAARE